MPKTTFHLNKESWERLNRLSNVLGLSWTKTVEMSLELLEEKLIKEGIMGNHVNISGT